MRTAVFHRMCWDYEEGTGSGKIHYEPLGIVGFFWSKNIPIHDINFLNKDEIKMYRSRHLKQTGRAMTHGVIIQRDTEIVAVRINHGFTPPPDQKMRLKSAKCGGQNLLSAHFRADTRATAVVETVLNGTERTIYGFEDLNLIIKVEGEKRYLSDPEGGWHLFDDDTPVVAYAPIKSLLGI